MKRDDYWQFMGRDIDCLFIATVLIAIGLYLAFRVWVLM